MDGNRRISPPHRVCRTADDAAVHLLGTTDAVDAAVIDANLSAATGALPLDSTPSTTRPDVRVRLDITRYLPSPQLPKAWSPLKAETHLVRTKYRHLYDLPVLEHSDGSRTFHDGVLHRCHGVNVLFLRGDAVEMAFQHGRLLADEIPRGALRGCAKLIENAIANTLGTGGVIRRWVVEQVQEFASRRVVANVRKSLARAMPDAPTLLETVALSESTGIAAGQIARALFNPEMLLLLAGLGRSGNPLVPLVAPPTCCTSFAAWGKATKDGSLLVGRNLDYPLNGFYDAYPTVIYSEPTDGLRHMSFTSSGVHNDGVTSYNEAGLFLASHVVPSSDGAFNGIPALVTADLATSRATSVAAAAEIFRAFPSPAGWGYLAVDSNNGEVGTLERSRRRFAVRNAAGETHVQTNRFLAAEMHPSNLFLNTSVDEDSDGRAARVQQRLAESGGVDAHEAITILADHVDPLTSEVRGLGNTVSLHTTLSSLVLDPARKRVLVSAGQAPACHGDFVELPLAGTFDRRDFPGLARRLESPSRFPESHPKFAKALQIFIRAKMAYEYDNDAERAYELLKEVVQVDDTNPAYFFQLGIFALKNQQHFPAIEAFTHVLANEGQTQQLRRLAHYYRGRAHGHLARSRPALADLEAVLDDPATDAKLRRAARSAAWRIKYFGRLRLTSRSLRIMMQQSDMLDY
jgi:tetratricopeptide (TPR) repeat protein